MSNGDRQGVQYSVGKERLWPATHDERIDAQMAEMAQRLAALEDAHQSLRTAVVALLTIAENDLRIRGTV